MEGVLIKDLVTPEWVQEEMKRTGVRQKDLVDFTGISKQNIHHWVNGKRAMSQAVKVMFYLIFLMRKDVGH